jgi:PPOX class probable F420-dependent enzyme
MPEKMSAERRRPFLQEGTRTAKLASIMPDGRPHVTPVWFVLDGDDVICTTWHTSAKARSLRRDARVSLCVDDDRPPFSFVMLEGTASISEDVAQLRHWATQIGARYMGPDRAEEFGARNGVAGELLIRITPTRSVAEDRIAG